MTDLIGDIHGHADELRQLLDKLGYAEKGGVYSHSGRKVLFLGDYIDRGPKIRETLQIVRNMVESGNAMALMGNHEYNALCYHCKDSGGRFLREHSHNNKQQHEKTLKAFEGKQTEFDDYLTWFMTLPLFYETESFRAVHACWDADTIAHLNNVLDNGRLTDTLLYESSVKDARLYDAVELTLKGRELRLPDGCTFKDKYNVVRKEIRIKWWEDPAARTYRELSVEENMNLPDQLVDSACNNSFLHYGSGEKKVFFGHYWLTSHPTPFRENVCCLDYSVADGGKLVGYRFSGEERIEGRNLEFV